MKLIMITALVAVAAGFIFWKDINGIAKPVVKSEKFEREKTGKNKDKGTATDVRIMDRWDLPAELKEVSGIAMIDNDRFACVQDEEGSVFIFNKASKQVEKKISFAGPGDYEGITVKGNTAFVVRADGRLYEVEMNASKANAKEYDTPLTLDHNIEGLCYDAKNNRLLLATKDGEPGNKDYKGIYAFDLQKKSMASEPVMKIDLDHQVFSGSKKKNKVIAPSAIGINPTTSQIYITDGPAARLLIMNSSGNIESLLQLGKEFAQPEGITFGSKGEVYISNEGTKQPGNIMQVEIR
jgi:uncharacterized protein YjiK